MPDQKQRDKNKKVEQDNWGYALSDWFTNLGRDPNGHVIVDQLKEGLPFSINNANKWKVIADQGVANAHRDNPYLMSTGDQARSDYVKALDQFMNATSAVGPQAAMGRGNIGSQVAAAASGNSGTQQAAASRAGAMGLAGNAGAAGNLALQEELQNVQNQMAGYGNLRKQDLSQAAQLGNYGLKQESADAALRNFYNNMAFDTKNRNRDLSLNKELGVREAEFEANKLDQARIANTVNSIVSIYGKMFGATAGKKGGKKGGGEDNESEGSNFLNRIL